MLSCDHVQDALSSRLDGESYTLADDIIDSHVANCPECTRFLEQAATLNRQLAFRDTDVIPTAPDLSDAILAGVEPQFAKQVSTQTLSRSLARIFLLLVGIAWMVAAIRLLGNLSVNQADVLDVDPLQIRLLNEGAAMRLALGFGLIFAAWQPRIAGGLVPIFGALWMFSFGFGVRDILVDGLNLATFSHLLLLLLSFVGVAWAWVATKGFVVFEQLLMDLRSTPR